MADIKIGDHTFRIGRLNAFDQLHVARRIAPLVHSAVFAAGPLNEALVAFAKGDEKKSDEAMVRAFMQSAPFLQALAQLPDSDVDFVIKKVMSVSMIEIGGHFTPCVQGGEVMVDNLSLTDAYGSVLDACAAPYFERERSVRRRVGAQGVEGWESLPDGEDFLLRPVAAGMCRFESLVDGTIDLEHVLIMNVYLDNRLRNEELLRRLNHGTA